MDITKWGTCQFIIIIETQQYIKLNQKVSIFVNLFDIYQDVELKIDNNTIISS